MRVTAAAAVFVATVTIFVWLYTYRAVAVAEYIDPLGRRYHAPQRLLEQPWWAVPAAVVVACLGTALAGWLLPDRTLALRRSWGAVARAGRSLRGARPPGARQ